MIAHFEWTKIDKKNAKMVEFWRVFEKLKLTVKQCYQTGQFYKTKIGWKKLNSNETYLVIFQHCVKMVLIL